MLRRSLLALLVASCASSTTTPPPDATPLDVAVDHLDASADVTDARADLTDVVDVRDARTPSPRCVNGVALPYPEAPSTISEAAPIADLRFATPSGEVRLHDWYAPCAEAPKILVIRTLTAWSGRAQHAASHTQRILTHPQRDRVALLDVLALGPDNTPATLADLAAWRARYDTAPDALAIDPEYRFQALYGDSGMLPLYVFVDTRTMRIAAVLERPSSAAVTSAITRALGTVDGLPRTSFPTVSLIDGRFTRDEWEMIQAMTHPGAPPPDPTNRVADDPRAARFGETLFNDTGFSSNNMVSCASCHAAATLYTDGRPHGLGVAEGGRNTPTTLYAPHARWLFLDGRVDTLWAQAIGPIENPIEMQFTRLAAVHRIATRYATEYSAIFGALPDMTNSARFPASGMPGTASWDAMTTEDRDTVNRVYVNLGKAIAAYERTLRFPTTAFDRYVAGDMNALTESQRDGLHHFFVNGCIQCHHGPTLSDDSFHNVGMPTGIRGGTPDRGRVDAIASLLASPFRSDGPFSDDRTPGAHIARIVEDPSLLGRFHTPSLRGVGRTGPWGHGGTFATLNDVVRHYALGLQFPPVTGTTGSRDIHMPWFVGTDSIVTPMVDFLQAL
ncbi:MAG: cytochrome c peroxidase [Polyangiales bacterium]